MSKQQFPAKALHDSCVNTFPMKNCVTHAEPAIILGLESVWRPASSEPIRDQYYDVLTNQRSVLWFIIYWPIRDQYYVLTNQKLIFKCIDQSEVSIQMHWPIRSQHVSVLTNHSSPVLHVVNLIFGILPIINDSPLLATSIILFNNLSSLVPVEIEQLIADSLHLYKYLPF